MCVWVSAYRKRTATTTSTTTSITTTKTITKTITYGTNEEEGHEQTGLLAGDLYTFSFFSRVGCV